ncbi:MAG TPA: sigma-70 family RNA polymerase sigma factor [Polyangia bacterium]|nr:sigma-70 family RNA polymerase sigma factor [Polyangia bacterium]
MSDPLPQLIRSAAQGDERAFAALHARYKKWVHAILLARLPPSDAEDQVQEVFLLAWKKLSQLDDTAGFGSWLGAIARHRAIECYRRRRPTEPLASSWPDLRSASSADLADAHRALAAIQSLPEAYRETLVMRLCEGMSGPEIADVTGLEHGSVRINLHRGMKLLREKLGIEERVAAGE